MLFYFDLFYFCTSVLFSAADLYTSVLLSAVKFDTLVLFFVATKFGTLEIFSVAKLTYISVFFYC